MKMFLISPKILNEKLLELKKNFLLSEQPEKADVVMQIIYMVCYLFRIDAEISTHAHWIDVPGKNNINRCSRCLSETDITKGSKEYCLFCGSKMDEKGV